MRTVRAALELGMELNADEERMIAQLHRLHDSIVRRGSGEYESDAGEPVAIIVAELITVTVTFMNQRLPIAPVEKRIFVYLTGITTQAHRSAHLNARILIRHKIDHLMGAVLVKLTGICTEKACDIPRKFDNRNLHSQAEP